MPAVVLLVEPVEPVEPVELDDRLHLATWAVWAFVSFLAEIILFAAFAPTVLSRHDLVDGSTTTALATLMDQKRAQLPLRCSWMSSLRVHHGRT